MASLAALSLLFGIVGTSATYTLVGDGACANSAGSPGTGSLKFTKTKTSSNPHTNCQATCNADSSCTGYDSRSSGCLYYKIQIAKSNEVLTTYQCYKKAAASSSTASAETDAVKATCCTPFADAKCSDWNTMSCTATGTYKVMSNSAPADGANGKTLSAVKFKELCCAQVAKKCSDFAAVWALSQLAGGGCAADKNFFDLKKTDAVVAGAAGQTEVKAACCTPFVEAKCSDWNTMSCTTTGTYKVMSNSAPADGADGKTLSAPKFKELCCAATAKKCSDFAVVWALSQLAGGGCAADKNFFDLKKTDAVVAGAAGETEVKAACCTPFAEAKCSDWNTMSCTATGTHKVMSNSAPADSADGKALSAPKFKEFCCAETTKKCSAFAGVWALSQLAGGGCAADKKFFDLKKTDAVVAAAAGETEVKAACCTPFADAKCSDWNTMTCTAGMRKVMSNAAPADGGNGKTLSSAKFKALCCAKKPQTCSDFTLAWGVAQAAGKGCALENKFFDLKKADLGIGDGTEVSSSQKFKVSASIFVSSWVALVVGTSAF